MKCPNCGKKVLGFREYFHGANGLRYECPHCQVALRASRFAFVAPALCLLALGGDFWWACRAHATPVQETLGRLLIIPIVAFFAAITYFVKPYRLKPSSSAPDSRTSPLK
jgi:hypothetical protein